MRMKLCVVAVSLVLFLTGCGSSMVRTPQGPPQWQQGYSEGCTSGYSAAGHPYYRWEKDPRRALDDRLYGMGWKDGFETCKSSYESTGRLLR